MMFFILIAINIILIVFNVYMRIERPLNIKIGNEVNPQIYASYYHYRCEIRINNAPLWRFEETLNHEVMHHVLGWKVSKKAGDKYDNINLWVDSYHS